jgi:Domain of unknown function (DUF4465)/Secretion system C-terminal sorting domain
MMTKFYFSLFGLLLFACSAFGQSYIIPEEGHKVAYFFSNMDNVQVYDAGEQFFYFSDGDTIYQADPAERIISDKFGKPADYDLTIFPSFLTLAPDNRTIWTGYTDLDNVDARIYSVDIASGAWSLRARLASNWDLAFWNDSILVSGLNSADYTSPNAIYVLDSSGNDLHRVIIETGGSSAGLAVDSHGNLYYGTSSFTEPNAIYRWDSLQLASVIESPAAVPLQLSDAEKLTDLPAGAYDCEVDDADNLVFTMNTWGATQVLARWNESAGDGYRYDTLATSTEWLGMVKSRGDYSNPVPGNSLFTIAYDRPIADLHTCDYAPQLTGTVPAITGFASESFDPIDMSAYVTDLDDQDGFEFEISVMSEPAVASLTVDGQMLTGSFGSAGQSNLHIVATSAGRSVTAETVVAAWPEAKENLLLSHFGEQTLDPESYWNGSDESGLFSSGPARFYNSYSTEYFSWSGWAYSNTSDVITPGYMNQYSAYTGEGFHGSEAVNNIYGISNLYGPAVIDFVEEKAHAPEGFFVTNSTYGALSMIEGDWLAKAFGGPDGNDPDYFKLLVWGRVNGTNTDSIEFYLADYRFENPEEDYLIKTWQWVDLSSLGKVDSLMFGLESSDNGEWGMNTPAYFCLDNLLVRPDAAPFVANPIADVSISSEGDQVIDLGAVFSDPDDDDALIMKSVKSNSNENLLIANITGNELTLSGTYLTKKVVEEVQLVVEGSLGGLSALDTVVVSVEYTTGINSDSESRVVLYPNPSSGQFTIELNTEEELNVTIYAITGLQVYANRKLVSGQSIDISDLPNGAYIVRIRHSGGVVSKMIHKL